MNMYIALLKVKKPHCSPCYLNICKKGIGCGIVLLLGTCRCFHQHFPKQNKRRYGAGREIHNKNGDEAQNEEYKKMISGVITEEKLNLLASFLFFKTK